MYLGKMIVYLSLETWTEMFTAVLFIIAPPPNWEIVYHLSKAQWKNTILLYNEALKCMNFSYICRNGEIAKTLSKTSKSLKNTYTMVPFL